MTNAETAEWLRKWCAESSHRPFNWPTDACGYDQHIKFVKHKNEKWTPEQAEKQTFNEFVLEYAASLEQ